MLAISSANNAQLEVIEPKEKDLQNFILANWANIFANFVLIKAEFELEGNVRSKTDKSGRIDILAFNPITNRLVVIELKRNAHANILHQASDYKEFVEDNFSAIYLQITQKHQITLPTSLQMDKNSVELILIAKNFAETDVQKAKKETNQNLITLVKYQAFSFLATPLYVFDFVNNEGVYFKEIKKDIDFTKELEQITFIEQNLFDKYENKDIENHIIFIAKGINALENVKKMWLEMNEIGRVEYLGNKIKLEKFQLKTLLKYVDKKHTSEQLKAVERLISLGESEELKKVKEKLKQILHLKNIL